MYKVLTITLSLPFVKRQVIEDSLSPVSKSLFSCAEPNVNEQIPLFELICIRFVASEQRCLNKRPYFLQDLAMSSNAFCNGNNFVNNPTFRYNARFNICSRDRVGLTSFPWQQATFISGMKCQKCLCASKRCHRYPLIFYCPRTLWSN